MTRVLILSATLFAASACGDVPTQPTPAERAPLAFEAPGNGKGNGAQFVVDQFTFFSIGAPGGQCRGDYVDPPGTSAFRRTNPDGTTFARKHYQVDPLRVVTNGETFTGTGQVFVSRTSNPDGSVARAVWTATGRVIGEDGEIGTAVCKYRAQNGRLKELSVVVR